MMRGINSDEGIGQARQIKQKKICQDTRGNLRTLVFHTLLDSKDMENSKMKSKSVSKTRKKAGIVSIIALSLYLANFGADNRK